MAFSPDERSRLLMTPKIGPGVVRSLEDSGIDTIEQLRRIGAQAALSRVCETTGSRVWRTRLKALQQFLRST
jgi:hypothetical protein